VIFAALSPGIDWRRISGLRDLLIHQYFGVDAQIVWDAATKKLPELERDVRELLARLGEQ